MTRGVPVNGIAGYRRHRRRGKPLTTCGLIEEPANQAGVCSIRAGIVAAREAVASNGGLQPRSLLASTELAEEEGVRLGDRELRSEGIGAHLAVMVVGVGQQIVAHPLHFGGGAQNPRMVAIVED